MPKTVEELKTEIKNEVIAELNIVALRGLVNRLVELHTQPHQHGLDKDGSHKHAFTKS